MFSFSHFFLFFFLDYSSNELRMTEGNAVAGPSNFSGCLDDSEIYFPRSPTGQLTAVFASWLGIPPVHVFSV
jgi:hypothetical protein